MPQEQSHHQQLDDTRTHVGFPTRRDNSADGREARWRPFVERYAKGSWRAPIFRDMLLEEARAFKERGSAPVMLDIGCGRGFDDDPGLQQSLALAAGSYLGVEPDPDIALKELFSRVWRSPLEEADIAPESVDIAFAVMVLEHIARPRLFWDRLRDILKPGGVFWGFTVDARHPFVLVSRCMQGLRLKERYLNRLRGDAGKERYENYPVFYRTNTPAAVRSFTRDFAGVYFPPLKRVERFDYYLPGPLRPLAALYSRCGAALNLPGSILAVRVEK